MLKILQARLQQYLNWELPSVQAGFRKGRGTGDLISNICWIIEKEREFQKYTHFCFSYIKALAVWITANCGEFLKRQEYQTTLPVSWETCMQVKKQQWELDTEQRTGSKLGKAHDKLSPCCQLSPCLFNLYAEYIMRKARQNEYKLESKLLGEIPRTSDMQTISL